eukprot:COSAG05_NODE_3125_length_2304_cov_12.837188_1_plen_447_part_00
MNSLTLDSNGIFGEIYSDGEAKEADKFVVEVQPLLDALKTSSITSLSLRSTGMGVKGVVAVADAIRAMAAVNSLTVDSTGDMQRMNGGPKTYTLTAGDVSIDLSSKNLGSADIALLTAWLQRPEVSAAIASLSLKGNLPCGRISRDNDGRAPWLPGKELEGWTALCAALATSKTITHLDVSDCLLGSEPVALLADAIKLMAALAEVVLDGCPLTGASGYQLREGIDSNMDGFVALCAVLGKLKKISLAGCGLGPASMGELAKAVSSADAAVAHISISGNMITGSTDVGYSFAKYDVDLSGIIAFGKVAAVSKTLTSIDLSNCGIAAAGIAEVTKFIAAVKKINLSGCGLTGATKTKYVGNGVYTWENIDSDMTGFIVLCGVLGKLHEINISDCGLGPASAGEFAKAVSSADAAIAKLDVRGNSKIGVDGERVLRVACTDKDVELLI